MWRENNSNTNINKSLKRNKWSTLKIALFYIFKNKEEEFEKKKKMRLEFRRMETQKNKREKR